MTPPPRLATTSDIMSTSSARYISTRSPASNSAPETGFADALLRGIAARCVSAVRHGVHELVKLSMEFKQAAN